MSPTSSIPPVSLNPFNFHILTIILLSCPSLLLPLPSQNMPFSLEKITSAMFLLPYHLSFAHTSFPFSLTSLPIHPHLTFTPELSTTLTLKTSNLNPLPLLQRMEKQGTGKKRSKRK
jgi:hypothetical protein